MPDPRLALGRRPQGVRMIPRSVGAVPVVEVVVALPGAHEATLAEVVKALLQLHERELSDDLEPACSVRQPTDRGDVASFALIHAKQVEYPDELASGKPLRPHLRALPDGKELF